MIGFDEELILQVMGRQVVITLAHPIVEDLEVWLETREEALLECVKPLVASTAIHQELV
jgi:hypothetical protein